MDKLLPVVAAIFGVGGIGGFLALFVVPASKKWESADQRLSRLEEKVTELEESNSYLKAGLTALSWHSDSLRSLVLRREPDLVIYTSQEVLDHVRRDIDRLTATAQSANK